MFSLCKECGASLPPNATFCKKCGNQVEMPSAAGSRPNVNSSIQGNPPSPPMSSAGVCSNCGSQLKAGSKFCRKCAAPVGPQMSQEPVGAPPASLIKSRGVIAAIVGVVAISIIVVVVFIANFGGDDPNGEAEVLAGAETPTVEAPPVAEPPPVEEAVDAVGVLTGVEIFERYAYAVFTLYVWDGTDFVGASSGFIIDPTGIAVTAHHCIGDLPLELRPLYMRARLHDGSFEYILGIYNYDVINDLAVIQLASAAHREFQYVSLGDSDDIRIGENFFVIGSPLGEFHNTISDGIHSAIFPLIQYGENYNYDVVDAIQFTAPITQGNSGGPVINDRGQVVGVVVAAHLGGHNLNFASPINRVDRSDEGLRTLTPLSLYGQGTVVIDPAMLIGRWTWRDELLQFNAGGTLIFEDGDDRRVLEWRVEPGYLVTTYEGEESRQVIRVINDDKFIIRGSGFQRVLEEANP